LRLRHCIRFAAAILLTLAAAPATAGPEADHVQSIAEAARKALAVEGAPLARREAEARHRIARGFDMRRMARFAIGRYWGRISATDRTDYVRAFQAWLLARYADRFGGYPGETFAVTAEIATAGQGVLVETRVDRARPPPPITRWRTRAGRDGMRIVDLDIDGRSLALTKRAEFSAILRRQGIAGLIFALESAAGRIGGLP